jgi:hypothetical protein
MLRMLDHVVRVVPDLRTAIDDHRRRGFTVTPGGEHADGQTHNALISFADGSYLELVAFRDLERSRDHRWWKHAAGGGLADFALLSDDLASDLVALSELALGPPTEGGRTRPDGVVLRWRTARLTPPLPFLIEDVTPRELRVPGGTAARHANGATRVGTLVVGARDLGLTERRYAVLRERGAPDIALRAAEADGIVALKLDA